MATHQPKHSPNQQTRPLRQRPTARREAQVIAPPAPTVKTAEIQLALAEPRRLSPQAILTLQRAVGNRAVTQLLQRNGTDQPSQTQQPTQTQHRPRYRHKPVFIPQQQPTTTPVQKPQLTQPATQNFAKIYADKLQKFSHLQADMSGRLADLEQLAQGYTLEDYSAQVLGRRELLEVLAEINTNLGKEGVDSTYRVSIREMIADMLLFSSLIISRVTEKKLSPSLTTWFLDKKQFFDRAAVEVISPEMLLKALKQIALKTAAKEDASAGIVFSGQESLAQRMLKLSLLNVKEQARKELQQDPLFQSILASPEVLKVMLASSGGLEQDFLNTCAAAAVNQDVLKRVGSIAGLLQIGRATATHIEIMIKSMQKSNVLKKQLAQQAKKSTSMESYYLNRVNTARSAFDIIEQKAKTLVLSKQVDLAGLQALTHDWNRQMQRLAAVIAVVDPQKLPTLTEKKPEDWVGSVAGLLHGRTGRRLLPVDAAALAKVIGQTVDLASPKGEVPINTLLNAEKNEQVAMGKLWEAVFQAGGTPFSMTFKVPVLGKQQGHSVYLKAILRGNEKLFALQDPMIRRYDFKSFNEMNAYIKMYQAGVPDAFATSYYKTHAVGLVQADKADFYPNYNDLLFTGKLTGTPETLSKGTVIVEQQQLPIKNVQGLLLVTVRDKGEMKSGVIKATTVRIF